MDATGRNSVGTGGEVGQTRAPGWAMRGPARSFALLLSFAGLLLGAANANALACTSVATGNWGVAGTWTSVGNCNRVPTAVDDVTIAAGHTVTLAAAPTPVLSLTLSGATSTLATGANILTVTGNLVINGTISGTGRIYSNGPALTPITIFGTGTFSGVRLYTSGTGGTTIPAGSNLNFLGTSRLYAGNNGGGALAGSVLTVNGTITAASTVSLRSYTGTAVAPGFIIGSTGALNATGATFAMQANSALTNNGSVTLATVTGGNATTSILTNAANSTLNVSGALLATGVLNATAAGNTVNYTGVAQTAKVTTYSNLTLSGSLAKTFATTPTVNGVLSLEGTATVVVTGAGVVTYGPAATLQYNKPAAYTTTLEEWPATFAATGGVIIANTGAITLNAAKVLNASVPLTINSGATLANGAFALSVAGNFTQNGTFTAGAGVFTLNGLTAVQTISGTGPLGFANLTVNNTGGITLARNVTVTSAIGGAVTLTDTCPMDYTLISSGGATVAHSCSQPVVASINLASANPTVAASVDWTVTFNQSMTGVSASNFTLVNGGLGGAPAITLVSGSGTTWTVTASTGTGTGTLGLNMTNVTGISPAVITPMPFTGQVYSVRPPPPVIYYHDTTLGVDIGFDGLTNVTGANQIIPPIITASLNPVSTCPFTSARSASHPVGLYTHSRWYLNANYAVATNISANPTGSASLRGVAVTDTVVVSLYDYDTVLGGKTLIGSSTPITLTGGGTTTTYLYTITSPLYTVPVGHRLMLEYNFNQPLATNNARVYCSAIASFISVTETPATVATADHFAVSHSGTGVTCQAEPITVAAHDAVHNVFTTQTASITLSTSTGLGDWSLITGGGTLTPGAVNSGSAVYVFVAGDNGQVTLGLKHTAAGSVSLGVTDGTATLVTGTGAAEADPPVVYSDAGFSVTDNAGNPVNIGSQIAGQTSGTLYLQAVKTAPNGACTGVFNTTVNIEMASQCNNPATCAGKQVTVNATALNVGYPDSTVPGASGLAGVNAPLAFGANSIAPLTLNYPDVGQIRLYVRYNMPLRDGSGSGNYMVGSSNPFVVKPGGFVLSAIQQTAAPNPNPAAADATGAKFVKAGEAFTATVTATTVDGVTTTPNYGQETTPESVKLTPALVTGLGLTNNPAIGGTFGAFAGGVATGAFTWNEVGIIKLTPSVGDGDYLGAGDVTGTASGNVGRFYAAQFALAPSPIANRTGLAGCAAPAGCGAFTYMGEQMSAVFTLTAQAVDGTRLQNYVDAFAKLDPTAAGALNFGAIDNPSAPATRTPLGARISTAGLPAATGMFLSTCTPSPDCFGTSVVTAPFMISRGAAADGPYAALDIGVAPVDSDGAALTYNLDTVNVVAGTPNHTWVGRTEARYGRMKLSNAHGSELLNLPIAIEAQYWQGQYWAQNNLDDATAIVQNNIKLATISGSAATISGVIKDAAGKWRIVLVKQAAPGSSNVCLDLDVGATGDMTCVATTPLSMPYLQTGAAFDKDPVSRATFGVYKGNNEFIYLREAY